MEEGKKGGRKKYDKDRVKWIDRYPANTRAWGPRGISMEIGGIRGHGLRMGEMHGLYIGLMWVSHRSKYH